MGRWYSRARHRALGKRSRALSSLSSPSQDATCSGLLGRSISLWTHGEGADVNHLGTQADPRPRTPSSYGGRAVSDARPGGPRGYRVAIATKRPWWHCGQHSMSMPVRRRSTVAADSRGSTGSAGCANRRRHVACLGVRQRLPNTP